jgi:hypothetical protein
MDPRDRDLIIRTVIGEAASQGPLGQFAVAHVIRNRLESGRYGKTGADVVLAPKQFEPWSTRKDELLGIDPNSPQYQRMAKIVDATFSDEIPDPTGGATHFQNEAIVRKRGNTSGLKWLEDMKRNNSAITLGDHIFGSPDSQPGASRVAKLPPTTWNDVEIEQASSVAGRPIQAAAIKGGITPPSGYDATKLISGGKNAQLAAPGGGFDHKQLLRILTEPSKDNTNPVRAEIRSLIEDILADTAPEGQGHAVVPRSEDSQDQGGGALFTPPPASLPPPRPAPSMPGMGAPLPPARPLDLGAAPLPPPRPTYL